LREENCTAPFTEDGNKRFHANLKGCLFHFRQSVKNVKSNGHVVDVSMATVFQQLADRMYDALTMPEFEKAVSDMRQRFPKARTWISWWTQPGHRNLIFKACRNDAFHEELRSFYNMPTTNNVVESNNRSTNRFLSYKDMPIVIAAHDVFKYCKHELRQLHGIRSGVVPVHHREGSRLSVVACRSDEYAKGQRAPISTSELLLGNGGAASAFKPVPPNSQLSQKRARTPEEVKALQERIRTDGLKPKSIVQVLNDQNDDKW
jgi:hypothetical protein